ncbi:hypothetical protein [Aeromicrobium fastidiosum]|uniref:hypothetical protein n=1 Tax=Aeromicrobium fastidiosum TaxID=52699 RepID=UPI00165F352C|nr:hypothetical protein [Aeromicrobium fastidiosum]MBP2392158.1 hypothetical protein [Aeromicrobium fastidiosum]
MHKNAEFLAAKRGRLIEPHVASINEFVKAIRAEIETEIGMEGPGAPDVYVP